MSQRLREGARFITLAYGVEGNIRAKAESVAHQ